jgi:hypothetical protein
MPIEINSITHMKYLSEVDLGWTDPPPGFIKNFVQQIGHSLIKIFLTACRRKFKFKTRNLNILVSSLFRCE